MLGRKNFLLIPLPLPPPYITRENLKMLIHNITIENLRNYTFEKWFMSDHVKCTFSKYAQCKVYSGHCTVISVQWSLYSDQCTVYSVQCTVYSDLFCTVCKYIIPSFGPNVQWVLKIKKILLLITILNIFTNPFRKWH